jgi:hypothetical protein
MSPRFGDTKSIAFWESTDTSVWILGKYPITTEKFQGDSQQYWGLQNKLDSLEAMQLGGIKWGKTGGRAAYKTKWHKTRK